MFGSDGETAKLPMAEVPSLSKTEVQVMAPSVDFQTPAAKRSNGTILHSLEGRVFVLRGRSCVLDRCGLFFRFAFSLRFRLPLCRTHRRYEQYKCKPCCRAYCDPRAIHLFLPGKKLNRIS